MLRARLTKRPPYLPYDFRSRFRLLDPSNKHAHRVLAVLVASRAHISTGLGLRTCGPPAPNWPSWRVAFLRSYAMPMAVWSLQHVLRQTQGPWRCGLSVALKCLTPLRIRSPLLRARLHHTSLRCAAQPTARAIIPSGLALLVRHASCAPHAMRCAAAYASSRCFFYFAQGCGRSSLLPFTNASASRTLQSTRRGARVLCFVCSPPSQLVFVMP